MIRYIVVFAMLLASLADMREAIYSQPRTAGHCKACMIPGKQYPNGRN